jgi:hypothetical protein
MRWLRRVRLTILHFADRTHVVADLPCSSKLLNATSQHTVAAPTTIICCTDEGYELVLSLYSPPQFCTFVSFTSASLLAYMSLFVSLYEYFPRLSFYVLTVSVSIFVCLFLPPFFSITMLCFSSYFHPLLIVLNFHFFSVSSLLSVIYLRLLFSLLVSSSFHVAFLVSCSCLFSCLFLFPIVFRPSQTLRFHPHFYIVLLLPFIISFSCLLFFPFLPYFFCNFFPLIIRKTPKLTPCTRYDVTSAHLLCRPSGVNWRRRNRRCNLPKK